MQVKLLLFTFYLHGRLHAVSVRKPSEQMSNFWTVRFLKIESQPNFSFPHIPIINVKFPKNFNIKISKICFIVFVYCGARVSFCDNETKRFEKKFADIQRAISPIL